MKKLIPFFALIFTIALVFGVCVHRHTRTFTVVLFDHVNPAIEPYVVVQNGRRRVMVSGRKKDYGRALEIIHNLGIQVSIAMNNIQQAGNHAYRRQFVSGMDENGNLIIETSNDVHWVYEPNNFAAEKTGRYKGYVAYPDVSVEFEIMNLKLFLEEISLVQTALRKIDPSLILSDYECEHGFLQQMLIQQTGDAK